MTKLRLDRMFIAFDARALHFPLCWPIVMHRIVLGGTIIPKGNAVFLVAPTYLIFRNGRLTDQIVQKQRRAGCKVLAKTHVCGRVKVRKVRRECIDEQDLLRSIGVRSYDGMLGIGELRFESKALLGWHSGAKRLLNAVAGT